MGIGCKIIGFYCVDVLMGVIMFESVLRSGLVFLAVASVNWGVV